MADINITITIPSLLVARVSAATGAKTKAEFQAWVRNQVKQTVVNYETEQAIASDRAKRELAEKASQKAIDDTRVKAEAEVTIT